jgi:DNA-binding NarL/FixJ family response regulator
MKKEITLALVGENRLYREGLRSALSQIADFNIVREEDTVDDLVKISVDQSIDLVLLSIDVEKPVGHDALNQILRLFPQMNILVLLDYPETCYYENAITEGASDAIPRFSGKRVIEQHIRSIMERKYPMQK